MISVSPFFVSPCLRRGRRELGFDGAGSVYDDAGALLGGHEFAVVFAKSGHQALVKSPFCRCHHHFCRSRHHFVSVSTLFAGATLVFAAVSINCVRVSAIFAAAGRIFASATAR